MSVSYVFPWRPFAYCDFGFVGSGMFRWRPHPKPYIEGVDLKRRLKTSVFERTTYQSREYAVAGKVYVDIETPYVTRGALERSAFKSVIAAQLVCGNNVTDITAEMRKLLGPDKDFNGRVFRVCEVVPYFFITKKVFYPVEETDICLVCMTGRFEVREMRYRPGDYLFPKDDD